MEKIVRKIRSLCCSVFGHKFRYNFPSAPNKAICERCHRKWIWTLKLGPDSWVEVDSFQNETRSDEELIDKWVR